MGGVAVPYLKLSDDFTEDARILTAGPLPAWLHLSALSYCARAMSDGFVPSGQLRRLADVDHPQQLAEVLVRVGLWVPAIGGWQVPDYLGKHGNHSRAEIEEYRAQKAEQMRRSRARRDRRTAAPVTRHVTGNKPATLPVSSEAVPPPAPAPTPAPTPVNQPLPLPPLPLSSSSTGPLHPDCEDVDLLLLDQLIDLFAGQDDGNYGNFGRDARYYAERGGVDPDNPAIPLAGLVYDLMRGGIGMERSAARRMVLAQPDAVADWLNNPDRWERARNPAGLLRARLDPHMQTREEQHG